MAGRRSGGIPWASKAWIVGGPTVVVVFLTRSRTNTEECTVALAKLAVDTKTTLVPSPLILGANEFDKAWLPLALTETRLVAPATRSRTKMSLRALESLTTKFVADDWKATKRPSKLSDAPFELLFACVPSVATEILSVIPDRRSCTNTSLVKLLSPITKLDALDLNAMNCPLPLIAISVMSIAAFA